MTDRTTELLTDPSVSDWLKNSLRTALRRDPVDAADDAAMLADLLAARLREMQSSSDR